MLEKYHELPGSPEEAAVVVRRPKSRSLMLGIKIWAFFAGVYLFASTVLNHSSFQYGFNSPVGSTTAAALAFTPFLKALDTNLAGNWSKIYTAEPHLAGTNYGLVEFTQRKFEEYGLDTEIDTYDILVSYPKEHDLKLLRAEDDKVLYQAPLKEDVLEDDATTSGNDTIPTFLGYAANGNVTAQYVYVNYGSREDFAKLNLLGVEVAGKIVIARYGGIFRGLKVKFAQEAGAVGVLLYSDPGDDQGITPGNGYKQYPEGPARQELSVQRGSVQFLGGVGATPGDPTTPGYASKPGVDRKDPHASIGKIPVLPISYREVKPILAKLNGHGKKAFGKSWEGELDGYDYSIGPNPDVTLNLYNHQDYNITPLWNVYGEIKGEITGEAILIGNHRDAWIKGGAGDPNSGSAVLLEVARALGALKASGFKFKRSIVLASWDGEEYGLLGSTEFGEFAAKRLQKDFVAYLNVDVAATGDILDLEASPILAHVLKKILKHVEHPEDKRSLFDHFEDDHKGIIRNLGSGSDYTVFLEHLGIPAVDMGFKGNKSSPIYHYHSNYDSYHWMSKYGDPGFKFHNTLAKYLGLLALELSDHQVIDFKLQDVSSDLLKYFNETANLIPKDWFLRQVEGEAVWDDYLNEDPEQLKYLHEMTIGYFEALHKLEFPSLPFPEFLVPGQCPHHKSMQMFGSRHHKKATLKDLVHTTVKDLHQLDSISSIFDHASVLLQDEYNNRDSLHWWQKVKLFFQIREHNKHLQYFERNFLHHHGLYEREWFKHIVFASGRFTGYAGQTFPGLREAIEDDDFDRLVHWLGIVSKTIRRISAHL